MRHQAVRSLSLLAGLAALMAATEASAKATVTVLNEFRVVLSEYQDLTAAQRAQIGITTRLVDWSRTETIQGNGGLTVYYGTGGDGWGLSGPYIQATASATQDGYARGAYALSVAIDVTNGTGVDLSSVTLWTEFSAYSPYHSSAAQVDRAPLEYALFDSRQYGEGIGDGHGCDTRDPGANPSYDVDATPPAIHCGVSSPDHSYAEAFLWDLKAGQTGTLLYTLALTVEAFSVPEPAALALLAPAALGLLGLRRRRG